MMKKSSIIAIASTVIALHVVLFVVLFERGRKKEEGWPVGRTAATAHAAEKPAAPAPSSPQSVPETGFEVPKLLPLDEPTPAPAPAPSRSETIATPGTTAGCLRADQPDRHTSKVYPSLVGNPCRGAIVVDAHTAKILYENHATTYCYPASITKLMTLLVVLDQIGAGKIHFSDPVKINREIAKIGGSQIWLDPRESGKFTVDDLLYAMLVHSANDAAYALALHVAGSRDAFVAMMNRKARELGMNATTYHSPHGLPPSDGSQPDISTPYDIAILCLAVLRHQETLRYTSTELKYIRDGETMLSTRNALARRVDGYPGCDGLKTGYHRMGGWSLAATARHNGQRVIAVALGAPDKKTRNAEVRKLLDLGFQRLETF